MFECSKCHTAKQLSEFSPRKDRARGHDSHCRDCRAAAAAARRKADPDAENAKQRNWRATNPERAKEVERAKKNKYRNAHPEHMAMHNMLRRVGVRQAIPVWADMDAIAAKYMEAAALSEATGVEHHVDHVVPLRSKLVCGFHVAHNMEVMPAADNIKKGNRFWPDMP